MDESFSSRAIEELHGGQLRGAVAPGAAAFLTAVRRAARCARLRTVAARVLRMFFLADAIFGTKTSLQNSMERRYSGEGLKLEFNNTKVKAAITL